MDNTIDQEAPPQTPEQLPLFHIGDEAIRVGDIPSSEVAWIQRLRSRGVTDVFWDHYRTLRGEGYSIKHSFAGAWTATGRRSRGTATTIIALADVLEVSRKQVHEWLAHDGALYKRAMELRANFWADRVPDVDGRLYERLLGLDATAADFKLAYQRARVPLSGEDSAPTDGWLQAVQQAHVDKDNGNEG